MNYLSDACKWAFPHSDPNHIIGAFVSGVISYAVEAGLRDERIGKVVAGMGFIGSGCFLATKGLKEGSVENRAIRNLLIGGGVASVAFGIYSFADGIMDLMNPNLPLNQFEQISPCWKREKEKLRDFSTKGCVIDDPESIAISKISISTSQIGNNNGICDLRTVHQVLNKLHTPFVKFDDGYYPKNGGLTGGACTAMSLDLAERVSSECHLHNSTATQIIDCFKNLAPNYNESNQIFRDRQCAFNTISVSPRAFDPARSKAEALASYHSFSIDQMIPDVPVRPSIDHLCGEPLEQFIQDVNEAPKGTYLVRTLHLGNNKRLENHGHSTTLFKLEKGSVYYDPSHGFQGFLNCELGEKLFESISEVGYLWGVSYPRLYRLKKK